MPNNDDEIRELREENERLKAAQNSPTAQAKAQPKKSKLGLIVGLGAVGIVVIVGLAGGQDQPTPGIAAGDFTPIGNATAAKPAPRSWASRETKDEMRGTTDKLSCLVSTGQVSLSPPYSTQKVDLCVRKTEKFGLDVLVTLREDGQFMCRSYEACKIKVKFDENPVQAWTAVGPSDGSTETIFINNEKKFLTAARGARKIIVEAEFYNAGVQQMTFETDHDLVGP